MSNISTKKLTRIENKKKKMAAYLEILKLKDKEKLKIIKEDDSSDGSNQSEPKPKRLKINGETNNNLNSAECKIINEMSKKSAKNEYDQLKEEVRKRAPRKQRPKLRLKAVGDKASLSVDIDNRIPIFLADIQNLLMYSQLGHHSPYFPCRWCLLEKFNRVSHTVLIIVENVSLYHYLSYESFFPFLNVTFENKVEVITPRMFGGDMIQQLASVPLTGTQKDKLIKKHGSLEAAVQATGEVFRTLRDVFPINEVQKKETLIDGSVKLPITDKFSRTQILLSSWQMVEENYPLPLKGELSKRYSNYVLTKDSYNEVTPFSPMFGLDCEMCRTTSGELELTRISVVNEKLEIIYEKFVKPENKIIDYLTRFSGITPKMLEGVTTSLADVQRDLRELLPSDAILVGQSLNFDMHTLRMMHPYIIDTSVIFNISGDRSRKTKLQTLAHDFLSERIQQGRSGHCSAEDSMACIKLTQLKLRKSLSYGDAVLTGRRDSEINYATSLFNHVTTREKYALIIADEAAISRYQTYLPPNVSDSGSEKPRVTCEVVCSNKTSIKRICNLAPQHSLTLAHLKITDEQLDNYSKGYNSLNNEGGHYESTVEKTCTNINKWINKIWNSMANNGLCVILFAGHQKGSSGAAFLQLKQEKL